MGVISAGYRGKLKESTSINNPVVGMPRFVAAFLNDGENPFREFLSEIQPGCDVAVQITLQVTKER